MIPIKLAGKTTQPTECTLSTDPRLDSSGTKTDNIYYIFCLTLVDSTGTRFPFSIYYRERYSREITAFKSIFIGKDSHK